METVLYTVKEVSELFHTNPTYIYALIKTGLLPALKLGSYKIRREAVDDFLRQYEGFDLSNPAEFVKHQSHNP